MAKSTTAKRDLAPSALPADLPQLAVRYFPVGDLVPYERNARTHSGEQVESIARSMLEFGWTAPALVDEHGIIAGHGRIEAAKLAWGRGLSIPRVPNGFVPCVELHGLTPAQRRAYILADNQLATKAGWDMDLLSGELADLKAEGFDLSAAGFEPGEVQAIEQRDASEGDTVGQGPEAGDLLALVNITIEEPRHKVEPGDAFLIGGRHHLLCCSVMEDWQTWAPLLRDDALFCPYPGVFVVYGRKAEKHPLVLVQPDSYIVGHILDRYEECFGPGAVVRLAASEPAA